MIEMAQKMGFWVLYKKNSYPAGFYLSNLEVTISEVRDE